ncbi:hypothetical protein SANTM175S_08094 [Streptomyces antimycoticus]
MLGSIAMNDHFLDDADLTDRMEQNLAEHACHLHRSMAGAAVTEAGDLLVADSGLDDDTFNIVAAARFTAADATARITETAESLARTGRRFSWWVGPASTPLDLTTLLTAAGLPASERETAMWAELDDTLPPPTVQGLDIQTVTTPEQLADYALVLAANWDPPADTVRRFFAHTRRHWPRTARPGTWWATWRTVRSAPLKCFTTRESPASTTSPPQCVPLPGSGDPRQESSRRASVCLASRPAGTAHEPRA